MDLVVQVGWQEGKRRILGVWETGEELAGENVAFRRVYQRGEVKIKMIERKSHRIIGIEIIVECI